MKLKISRKIFEKYSKIKFRENPFSGSGRTDRHDKLVVALHNFAKASEN